VLTTSIDQRRPGLTVSVADPVAGRGRGSTDVMAEVNAERSVGRTSISHSEL
jgi:hypothetical protein